MNSTAFENVLLNNLKSTIRRLRKEGTVSMTVANLQAIVPAPTSTISGAPRGTNAQSVYAQLFRNVCNQYASSFILSS